MRKRWLCWVVAGMSIILPSIGRATPEESVKRVYIVFKTHLDVGYTDLSSRVTEHYVRTFIPKAMDVAERFDGDGSGDRFVWTVGSWLIRKYLETAEPAEVARLERHLRAGTITYGAIPYTVESESLTMPMYKALLGTSKELDAQYGHHTTGAKQSDVPGHTRAIIDPLAEAGVQFLHIGVNSMSPVPKVPDFFRWRAPSGRELLVCCQQYYGQTVIMPGGESVLSIQCTSDNCGPHTYEQAKEVYADLRKRYPNAQAISTTLDTLGEELAKHREELPVITSEIGDTWIYGYASEPARMARFRALMRKYAEWIAEGNCAKAAPRPRALCWSSDSLASTPGASAPATTSSMVTSMTRLPSRLRASSPTSRFASAPGARLMPIFLRPSPSCPRLCAPKPRRQSMPL
ncbi:MAG: hypothetical protein ACI4RT_01390 [Candidatus Spyradenecus sp.]